MKAPGFQIDLANTDYPDLKDSLWIVVYELTSCSESLAPVGSKYLKVSFHRLDFTIVKRFFMKMLKRIRKNFLKFSSAAHILMPCVYTELRPYKTFLVGIIWYSHLPIPLFAWFLRNFPFWIILLKVTCIN